MAGTPEAPGEKEVEKAALRRFLQAQRDSVVAVVAGLDDDLGARVVVPSGWSPADLVDHLRGAEQHWCERVVAGTDPENRGDPFAGDAGPGPRALSEVVPGYREQWARSDEVLARTDLDAPTHDGVPANLVTEVRDLRAVLLHLIEETARHAGHLDVVRELIDGRVGLGPR